jgi:hypothetical protein
MADGRVLPAETVETGTYWGDHYFADLVVPVTVAASGYASLVVEEAPPPAEHPGQVRVNGKAKADPAALDEAAPLTLENEFIAARLDKLTGGIASLVDKKSGVEFVPAGQSMGVVEYLVERPRGMSAWSMADPKTRLFPVPVTSLRLKVANPYVASVESKMKIGESDVSVTYTLRSGGRSLEVALHAVWLERGSPEIGTPKLRMLFPAAVEKASGTYEIPFGTITRDLVNGEEVPGQRFADVTGQAAGGRTAGVLVLNDSKDGPAGRRVQPAAAGRRDGAPRRPTACCGCWSHVSRPGQPRRLGDQESGNRRGPRLSPLRDGRHPQHGRCRAERRDLRTGGERSRDGPSRAPARQGDGAREGQRLPGGGAGLRHRDGAGADQIVGSGQWAVDRQWVTRDPLSTAHRTLPTTRYNSRILTFRNQIE